MRLLPFVMALAAAVGLSAFPGGVPAARAQSATPAKSQASGEKSAETAIDLPAKSVRGVRMRDMPAGARVLARVRTDGEIRVFVVDAAALKDRRFERDALFAARVRDVLDFAFAFPRNGSYFLVLDNRLGDAPRKVKISLKARSEGPRLLREIDRLSRELAGLFIDAPPKMTATRCGADQAVRAADDGGIALCLEYVEALIKALPDRSQVGSLVLFTLVRAAGADLLERWDDPAAKDGARLNEFAATLMVMLKQRRSFSRTLAALAEDGEALAGIERVYRAGIHPGIAEDAARLRALLGDGRRLARWRDVLVRRLRTRVLEQLVAEAPEGTDLSVVQAEIDRRKKTN